MPKLVAPGVALLGCSAGMVNVPRIKGNHNAMLSGKAAAEAAVRCAIKADRSGDELTAYEDRRARRRNRQATSRRCATSSRSGRKYGLTASLVAGRHGHVDQHAGLLVSGYAGSWQERCGSDRRWPSKHKPIDYPKPDGAVVRSPDQRVLRGMTNHEESQPCHLRLADDEYSGQGQPAQVRRTGAALLPGGRLRGGTRMQNPRFVINFQNCVHCKTCDIKDPKPEHHLDHAAGRRRAELSKHVSENPGNGGVVKALPLPLRGQSPSLSFR